MCTNQYCLQVARNPRRFGDGPAGAHRACRLFGVHGPHWQWADHTQRPWEKSAEGMFVLAVSGFGFYIIMLYAGCYACILIRWTGQQYQFPNISVENSEKISSVFDSR